MRVVCVCAARVRVRVCVMNMRVVCVCAARVRVCVCDEAYGVRLAARITHPAPARINHHPAQTDPYRHHSPSHDPPPPDPLCRQTVLFPARAAQRVTFTRFYYYYLYDFYQYLPSQRRRGSGGKGRRFVGSAAHAVACRAEHVAVCGEHTSGDINPTEYRIAAPPRPAPPRRALLGAAPLIRVIRVIASASAHACVILSYCAILRYYDVILPHPSSAWHAWHRPTPPPFPSDIPALLARPPSRMFPGASPIYMPSPGPPALARTAQRGPRTGHFLAQSRQGRRPTLAQTQHPSPIEGFALRLPREGLGGSRLCGLNGLTAARLVHPTPRHECDIP
jgi:hypothetical protein